MFKFMKSKKGFTLVELMIVVVIMAILVAVAVPIFSAVTENARTKTCIGNQREIVSSVGNWLMLQDSTTIAGTFTTSGGSKNPTMTIDANGSLKDYKAAIEGLFKTVPVCPDEANEITVTIAVADDANSKCTVSTQCNVAEGGAVNDTHKVPGT